MALLFSYGSNSVEQLSSRIGRKITDGKRAILENHERVFAGYSKRWKSVVATLRYHPGKNVYGWICTLNHEEISRLDEFEGAPFGPYHRSIVLIVDDKGQRLAWAYMSCAAIKNNVKPKRKYYAAMKKMQNEFWPKVKFKV